MIDLQLPITPNPWWALVIFLVGLIAFHFLLVWPRNLSKLGWKVVDYFWLATALLGVLGAVGIARQSAAQHLLATANVRVEGAASIVESALRFGTSGAICRKFVRSEYSPPPEVFNRIQGEFDEQCKWFTMAWKRLETSPFAKRTSLTLQDLGNTIPRGGEEWAITYLRESLDRYNMAVANLERLIEAEKRTDAEKVLSLFAPFLLAIALALRVAKVTGELLHERR
ncbi:MAG: hypothetical protein EPN55_00170 [Gammaproteobacteria bacterium]|nr:MAG: hypothetical protein EPN55_00170 [Gammaproteobacteria bacterium]